MADRNVCVVANRVVRLLGSEEVVRAIGGVDDKHILLLKMKNAISTMLPLLHDLNEYMCDEELWHRRVRSTLNAAEDSLERFIYESLRGRRRRTPSSQIIIVLARLTEDLECFLREATGSTFESPSKEREIRVPKEEEVLGVKELVYVNHGKRAEGGEAAIFDFMFDDDSEKDVLVVAGYNKEKTIAVARSVFDSDCVRNHFQSRIWSFFSGIGPELTLVSSDGQTTTEKLELCLEKLTELLCNGSEMGNRCLCVFDADFMINSVHDLRAFLLEERRCTRGSKVLIFTYNWKIVFNKQPAHYLDTPSVEDTRGIFDKMAFGGREPQEWHDEARRKCEFLPFITMMAVAGTLYFEESEAECNALVHEAISIVQGPYHFGDDFLFVYLLELCYDRLPSNLKHCFAYCSLFPRDHEFDVQTLVRLWMAQGFIDDDDEDLGYGYFLNLLRRFFFYEAKVDVTGRVTSCLMHDSMYDLSRATAQNHCSIITDPYDIPTTLPHFSSCVKLSLLTEIYFKPLGETRSFLLPTWKTGDELYGNWNRLLYNFESLRALEIHGLVNYSDLQSIDRLIYLRYLDLSHNHNLEELPNSICKLLFLQTLRLSSCLKLRQLPKDIGNLVNLRHLEMDGLASLPRGFGRLTNLRTMPKFTLSDNASTANNEVKELKQLHNLRVLRIKNLRHGMHDFLDNFKKLRSLSIEWEYRDSRPGVNKIMLKPDQLNGIEELSLRGCRDLNYMFSQTSFPNNLIKLSLKRCMKCQVLPSLDQCVNLRMLVLDDMPDLEYVTEDFNEVIRLSLQEVWLMELRELKGWSSTGSLSANQHVSSFARLLKLVIEDCPKFSSFMLFPTLTEGLVLDSTSWELFEQTVKLQAAPTPLSKLNSMCIVAMQNFDNSKAEGIPWETLESLSLLKLDFLPKLEALPEGLVHVKNLRELHIWRCGVKELPSWIGKLELLEKLVIRVCPDLKTFPEEMKTIKSLKTLEIQDCTTLLRRCEKEIGMDWCKIAHIPDIKLGQISITRSS